MNCATCGREVTQGVQVCPHCGAGLSGYAPSQHYPTGYQQPYVYGQPMLRERRSLLTCVSELPRAFLEAFTRPGEALRTLVEERDFFSAPVLAVISLALFFVWGMVVSRGLVGLLFDMIAQRTGVSMAANDVSMRQGINYIARRVGPSVGGIAALCQAVCILIPATVYVAYLCAVVRIPFSWELWLNYVTVMTLCTPVAALLSMALSMLWPWLALIPLLCVTLISHQQGGSMLATVTGRDETQLFGARAGCAAVSVILTMLTCGLLGGWLMGGVTNRVLVLLASVGSLF